jgi:hypothetical protein
MEISNKLTGEQLSLWTSFAGDTHANHSAPQENVEAQTTHDICGHGYEQPLANYDPVTQSWKTYGDTSLWGEQPSLATLPKSGMTQSGALYRQPDWVPITAANGSLSWPTPRAAQAESRNHTVYLRSTGKPQNLENKLAVVDPSTIGGKLNPTWVEWLMGFPLGWTDLED